MRVTIRKYASNQLTRCPRSLASLFSVNDCCLCSALTFLSSAPLGLQLLLERSRDALLITFSLVVAISHHAWIDLPAQFASFNSTLFTAGTPIRLDIFNLRTIFVCPVSLHSALAQPVPGINSLSNAADSPVAIGSLVPQASRRHCFRLQSRSLFS